MLSWFALYTHPRAEKAVEKLLREKGIETFLPLIKELRQWTDRKKWVEVPLFRSYVFVKIDLKDRFLTLNTAGVVRLVSFGGKPVSIPDSQIEDVRNILNGNLPVEVEPFELKEGKIVEVINGKLKGLVGILDAIHGKTRVLVNFESIGYKLCINIDRNLLRIV